MNKEQTIAEIKKKEEVIDFYAETLKETNEKHEAEIKELQSQREMKKDDRGTDIKISPNSVMDKTLLSNPSEPKLFDKLFLEMINKKINQPKTELKDDGSSAFYAEGEKEKRQC